MQMECKEELIKLFHIIPRGGGVHDIKAGNNMPCTEKGKSNIL